MEELLLPQGQSTMAFTPILVSGQVIVISRFLSPDIEGMIVTVEGQPSIKGNLQNT